VTETFFDDAPRAEAKANLAAKSEPRLWWRPPGHTDVFTLIPDASGTSTFHFAPFDVAAGAPEISWRGHAVRTSPPESGTLPHVPTAAMPNTAHEEHVANVEAALTAIRSGEFDKVVVSRTRVSNQSVPPELAFQNLCTLHPHALVYLMNHPVEGTWCGATPELLLRAQQHDVDTVSLAGTRRIGSEEAWTDKERQEQQVVTDHVLDVLNRLGAEDINQDGPRDKRYGELVHLETRISARYPGDLHALAKALHPTPAVCGRPVEAAANFIRTHERHNRTYYAGFLGWSSPLGCAYYVNLRCAHWAENGVALFAGGGIVEGSVPEREWSETEAKLQSISPAFQG
jgi:isochorismate synthase